MADGSLSVSGTRTNLKGGGGHRSGTKRRKKIGRAPPLFGSNSAISRYGERFRDGQCNLVSLLFDVLLLTVLLAVPMQLFVTVGARAPMPNVVGPTESKVVKRCNNIVSYEFILMRSACGYI